ncbi:MAG: glucose 1-dehydrogenase [Alphaproteobacteria bacterium]
MGRLDGKVALVTGGASGIGAAVCLSMVSEGAQVLITDIDDNKGGSLASALGNSAVYAHQDVRSENDWRRVIEKVGEAFGALNVLVNNAGVGGGGGMEEETLEGWRAVMAINSDAVFLGCQQAIAAMKDTGGTIINISSVYGLKGGAFAPAYSASKGAVRLLTKSVALYCAGQGYPIRCNSVHPGYVETPLVTDAFDKSGDPEGFRKMVLDQHPLGRLGRPDDIAPAVVYLASDEAAFVTGSELVVDGGFML